MRVVLVGGGGREAALAWRIGKSPSLSDLVVLADNPGWPNVARRVLGDPVEAAVSMGADLVVVGPEAPLADGIADKCAAEGIACFGPTQAAARLESSKWFAKEVMKAAGVPTAGSIAVDRGDLTSIARARERLALGNVVLKADGLAAGKGVFVCRTAAQAKGALDELWSGRFGPAADKVVLEDLLEGPEVSLLALCDGERAVALPSVQDHKRLWDNDRGPNTGGMGAYARCPLVSEAEADRLVDVVHTPILRELARRGTPFRGVLFAGLMMTPDGPRVLEYNARFGDPECQPLMCLWEDDVLPWLHGAAIGKLPEGKPAFSSGAACCVVLASPGYPLAVHKGIPIVEPPPIDGVVVFHSGTKRLPSGELVTEAGRVLGVTGTGPDLRTARDRAYQAVEAWRFPGAEVRSDIGAKGL